MNWLQILDLPEDLPVRKTFLTAVNIDVADQWIVTAERSTLWNPRVRIQLLFIRYGLPS